MKQEYEQMELDTRKELDKVVTQLTSDAIGTVQQMIANCGEAPLPVRNRHEAYGIASEHYAKISTICKSIKNDVGTLLGTLADPNYPAVEATSSIVNSTASAAAILLIAAAEMKRTLDNLYIAESSEPESTPMDNWVNSGSAFEEAEPADGEDAEE